MKLFLGEYSHTLDDRGRVTLPKKVRQEIDGKEIIILRGFDQCIFCFDRVSWENEAGRHLEGSITEDRERKIRRYLFAAAEKVDVDKLGRVLLPTQLKDYAGISEAVIIIGAGDHFEIWNRESWKN